MTQHYEMIHSMDIEVLKYPTAITTTHRTGSKHFVLNIASLYFTNAPFAFFLFSFCCFLVSLAKEKLDIFEWFGEWR